MQAVIALSSSSSVQRIIMVFRNVWNIVVTKASTLDSLRAHIRLEARLDNEESMLCHNLVQVLDHDLIPLPALKNVVSDQEYQPGYAQVWEEWVDIAVRRSGLNIS